MKTLGICALIGLIVIALLAIGASSEQPCQSSIVANRPDWWVLTNNYGTFDLIVYPAHVVVFDLSIQQAHTLNKVNQVGVTYQADGTFMLCRFR